MKKAEPEYTPEETAKRTEEIIRHAAHAAQGRSAAIDARRNVSDGLSLEKRDNRP